MGLKQGLEELERHSLTLSGTTVYGADIIAGAGTIGTTELADSSISGTKLASGCVINRFLDTDACSGTKVSVGFPTVSIGSPAAYANSMQAGTASFVNGGSVVVSFGKAFAGTPYVLATVNNSSVVTGSREVSVSGASVTGFVAFGYSTNGSNFNWLAVGSGRI
jgi:hypothetical protein